MKTYKNLKVNKIFTLLKKAKIDKKNISPNFIADFAYNRGINLTSNEVIIINNVYIIEG